MDLEQCVAFMLEIDVPETIQSASDIAELVSLKILIKEEAEEDQSKEDDVDWSIDTLQVYHEQFSMVCIPEGCYADDQSATIIPNQMWISQHPISQALFALVLNQPYRSDQSPVTNISWWEAVRFCNALSTLHGKRRYYRFSGAEKVEVNVQSNGFRLPFAVEWNYSFSSSRTLLFQDCDSEWMQDRFCLNQEQLPKEQVHDVVALESISSRWYKRLICGSDREQESKEPKLCSASCGFRVVLHSPVKNLEKRT
jgi:hypothetical protein